MKKNRLIKIMLLVLALMMIPAVSQTTVHADGIHAVQKGKTGWVKSGNRNYYYLNGRPISPGWHRINGVNCYFERYGRAAMGWVKYNNHRYFMSAWGRPVTNGWNRVNGVNCYFNQYGHAMSGWLSWHNKRYYLNSYGRPLTGWQTIAGKRHYFDQTGRAVGGWFKYRGMYYCLNSYGRVHYGWQKIGAHRYFFDMKYGYAKTGWQTINGVRCCFDSQGRALTGRRTLNGIIYTFNSYGRVISSQNPVIYRSLSIGEADYPGSSNDLPGCANDSRAMAAMCRRTGYTTANYVINATYSKIRSEISRTFTVADSNDVSVFHFSGHGSSGGYLVTVDNNVISPYTLASWLKAVPGNVVVILDSCYSGAVIGKDAKAANPEAFNRSVIDAFDSANQDLKAKGGPMSTSKFRVITACSKNHLSYATDVISLLTGSLVEGVGFDYYGNKQSYSGADRNKDKKVTFKECYDFAYQTCYKLTSNGNLPNIQTVQCYPSNSNLKLFQR